MIRKRNIIYLSAGVLILLMLYWLSIGPALYLAGVRMGQPKENIPRSLRVIYSPIFSCPFNWMNSWSDHYVYWWITVNDKRP